MSNYENDGISVTDASFLSHIRSNVDFGSLQLSSEDVLVELKCLNNSRKLDIDQLSPFFLKMCAPSLYCVLLSLFNQSLATGTFIDQWKISLISPLYKKGNKCDIANYRPIAKTSTISKIFERIVKKKLVFVTKSIISTNQHGFCCGRSTVTNLATFTRYCVNALDSGHQVDAIYTDFSKAFDKVIHAVLLAKLYKLGFHSYFHKWLSSYLNGRVCRVVVENTVSKSFVAKSGVPQGSILGPLLFILFINDVSTCFDNSEHLLYADDLKIFRKIGSQMDSNVLQAQLNVFAFWCKSNYLHLNVEKCVHVTFSRSRSHFNSNYSIDNNVLVTLDNFLDLGVMFDKKLSFINHINFIIPKAYAALAFIRRNSGDFADPYTLKILYSAYVRSKLEYAAIIWNPFYSVHVDRIERIQKVFVKFALRSIKFSEPLPSYYSRCLLLGLKSLCSRRKFLSMVFIFDLLNSIVDSPSLLECINFHVPSRSFRNLYLFGIPSFKSNFMLNEPITRNLILFNSIDCSKYNLDFFASSRSNFKSILYNLV